MISYFSNELTTTRQISDLRFGIPIILGSNGTYEMIIAIEPLNKKTFQKILENNHLIFLIPNKHVFSFHTNKKKVARVLNSLNLNSPFVSKQFVGLVKKQKVGNVGINIYKRFF